VATQIPSLTITSNFKLCKEQFLEGQRNRLLYLAKTDGGQTILVEFVRQYCPELHGICALPGHAPPYLHTNVSLTGVAMEYVADTVPVTMLYLGAL